jgi:hypothetical protein
MSVINFFAIFSTNTFDKFWEIKIWELFEKSKNVIPRNFPFRGMEKIPRKNFRGKKCTKNRPQMSLCKNRPKM